MPEPALAFRGLRRGFGPLRVLDGASGAVERGQVLLVTGGNGAGKSTLLRCLAGLLAPEAGVIELREGAATLEPAARRRRVGYLAPDLAFYAELTAAENLRFYCKLRRVPTELAADLLERVGVPADRLGGALSSGMRQRLRWAWALLGRPAALLLDEPFQNLDGEGVELARALLAEHLAAGPAVVASPAPLDLPGVAARLELPPMEARYG
jgi:ABC-type multidrug transport system ATPase subunit